MQNATFLIAQTNSALTIAGLRHRLSKSGCDKAPRGLQDTYVEEMRVFENFETPNGQKSSGASDHNQVFYSTDKQS